MAFYSEGLHYIKAVKTNFSGEILEVLTTTYMVFEKTMSCINSTHCAYKHIHSLRLTDPKKHQTYQYL